MELTPTEAIGLRQTIMQSGADLYKVLAKLLNITIAAIQATTQTTKHPDPLVLRKSNVEVSGKVIKYATVAIVATHLRNCHVRNSYPSP